jgi:2,4-dienoyl-CoA reductase (NADPH2)
MIGKARFEKLFEPHHIGKLQVKNRIVKTAASTHYIDTDSYEMSDRAKAYYGAIARGGTGLVNVEAPIVKMSFKPGYGQAPGFGLYPNDDQYIQGLSELTDVIHKNGARTFIQIFHQGPWWLKHRDGVQPIAASPATIRSAFDWPRDVPRALTIPEIEQLVDDFASCTVRAHKAGFDGVEINAACDHLISTFLSPFWNKRRDIYGCESLENRVRFLVEIIREIKKRTGQDFPMIILMNGIEVGGGERFGRDFEASAIVDGVEVKEVSEGITLEEGQAIAQILEKEGVDALHIRSHWFGNHVGSFIHNELFFPEPVIPLKSFPKGPDWSRGGPGANIPIAAAIKKSVSIPIITVGGFDPILAEKILREGKADFIGFNRRLMADPELPNKIASGRLIDVAPCTACGQCLHLSLVPLRCRINAALGTRQYEIRKAESRKRVLVVGGGAAGMEAARVAALRGHEVVLYEKTHKLGGLLPLAALVKGLEIEDLPAIVRYLKRQITNLGVKIRLGKEVDVSVIRDVRPDVVILATGGIIAVPNISGINRHNVISTLKLHHNLKNYLRFFGPRLLRWLTKFWLPIGKKVVVIGGGLHGCEVAEFLVKRGRKVTITDTAKEIGDGVYSHKLPRLLYWFRQKGVTIMTQVEYEEITDKGLTIITKEGKRQTIEADSILYAMPLAPNTELLKSLDGKVPEIYSIGDCREPLLITDAIADGWQIASKI